MIERLRAVGLRPTQQRIALARLLFSRGDRHLTADQVHHEAQTSGVRVSLATIYNCLHQFTEAGLLRELVIEPGKSYFDTNVVPHHHFYIEAEGRLVDLPHQSIALSSLPNLPEGYALDRVEVVVRLQAQVRAAD